MQTNAAESYIFGQIVIFEQNRPNFQNWQKIKSVAEMNYSDYTYYPSKM